jgi:hypothetical protein
VNASCLVVPSFENRRQAQLARERLAVEADFHMSDAEERELAEYFERCDVRDAD